MGKQTPITTSFHLPDGREVIIETGKLATQADGSVLIRCGNTMLLATAVSNREMNPNLSFFPLSVDYQEKFASAGRIPGNFFRRETKLNDYEVLTSRLVDRAIRPLFPDGYMYETQIILTLISCEKDALPDCFAALGASAALAVSDIPFNGPISEVRIAMIEGEFVVNPSRQQAELADLNLIVAATMADVTMVEGEAKECQEEDFIRAIKYGHEVIKVQIEAQLALAEKVNAQVKRVIAAPPQNEEVKAEVAEIATAAIIKLATTPTDKKTRKTSFKAISDELSATLLERHDAEWMTANKSFISKYFDKLKKGLVRQVILDQGIRLDGRGTKDIRDIWSEVNYLPSTHGSAVFNRGETQALASLTLGTKLDEAMNDTALIMAFDRFMLHYNFPGYSVGEVKPQRAPARREVGHAKLAGRSLKQVLPDTPYTIRIVSDILESNGSSSMATVCAGSLALMDAGIPMPAGHVAGIAMGMIAEGGKIAILSDILGDEDALGDMDFKVTGTAKGITGCQMDIKIDGLPYEQLEQALAQAKIGRLHIIGEMNKTIATSNSDYKPHAPRIVELQIDRTTIGGLIGPGGSIVQELQRSTGTVITITEVGDKGFVCISSPNKESIDAALVRVKMITHVPEPGNVYDGEVEELTEFGAFINFMGRKGLLHVSEISYTRVENVGDVLNVGDKVKVKLLDVERGKYKLSMKALLPTPEGYVPRPPRSNDDRRGGGDRRDDRRGGGGDRRPPRY